MIWLLADAKNRFSEVVTLALTKGPQIVRRRNQSVVIMAEKNYRKLIGREKSFKEHLLSGPDMDDLDLSRDESGMRDLLL